MTEPDGIRFDTEIGVKDSAEDAVWSAEVMPGVIFSLPCCALHFFVLRTENFH